MVREATVGSSGLRVSTLGLGTTTWGRSTPESEATEILEVFRNAGGTLIDVSPNAVDIIARQLVADRHEFVVSVSSGVNPAAPFGQRVDCSRRNLLHQLDTTLQRLNTDYIDLWNVGYWDPHTPPDEVADTLAHMIQVGKVRYAGVRGYNGWQLAVTRHRDIISAQAPYNLLQRSIETDLLPAAQYLGVGVIAGAPLAQGVLSGQYRRNIPGTSRAASPEVYADVHGLIPESHAVVEALKTAAEGLGISTAITAASWVISQPGISAMIATPRTTHHCRELITSADVTIPRTISKAFDDVTL
ncbi:aldo/keto reductase [Corynebacterium ulcerans]|uniref:aldo/keto reductase n=1 Tax=Corynebacterium ulcerans TaxID=65058 RepID=UPI0005FEAB31|nr:aldo/keto reductase [Corynebacterium ulcerans]AKA96680.1 Aldo/keto reductase family oxidoreductase [Corynebacterium ulcerans]